MNWPESGIKMCVCHEQGMYVAVLTGDGHLDTCELSECRALDDDITLPVGMEDL